MRWRLLVGVAVAIVGILAATSVLVSGSGPLGRDDHDDGAGRLPAVVPVRPEEVAREHATHTAPRPDADRDGEPPNEAPDGDD